LEVIDGCGATLEIPAAHVVVRQDTAARECFVIRSGLVQVFEGERHVATRGPGEWIGEMALLDGTVRCASARTVARSELIVFDAGEMSWLLRKVPSLTVSLRTGLVQRQTETAAARRTAPESPGERVLQPLLAFG
jgi:CRP/FNR family cyclic AMP-dependent transcriptional regulator